jgi:hypothetical protein
LQSGYGCKGLQCPEFAVVALYFEYDTTRRVAVQVCVIAELQYHQFTPSQEVLNSAVRATFLPTVRMKMGAWLQACTQPSIGR